MLKYYDNKKKKINICKQLKHKKMENIENWEWYDYLIDLKREEMILMQTIIESKEKLKNNRNIQKKLIEEYERINIHRKI